MMARLYSKSLLVFLFLCGTLMFSGTAAGNGDPPEEKALHAVVGGTVLPVSGPPVHRGVVLFKEGKILEVGSEISIPEGAVIHSAEGKFVSPGLVAIEAYAGGAPYTQGNFGDSLDPYHRDLKIALACGITTLQVLNPNSRGFSRREAPAPGGGATAVIKATVGDLESMLLREPASFYLLLRRSMLSLYNLREKFEKAREYLKVEEEASRAKRKPPKVPRGLESHVKILKRELPAVINASDLESIRFLLDLRREFTFDLVISGADDGWRIAPEVASLGVPVLVKARGRDFNFNLDEPLFEEGGMIPIRRPAAYASAGVPVVLRPYRRAVSLGGLAGRDLTALNFEAAFAVRGGMEELAAMRAITLEPARVLRVADRVGSLEKEKDADILIWSGQPLHYRSFVEKAWINGKLYYDREKSSLFREIPLSR